MDYSTPANPVSSNYTKDLHNKLPKVMKDCCDNLGDCTLEDINNFRDYLFELSQEMRRVANETITVDDFHKAKEEPETPIDDDSEERE